MLALEPEVNLPPNFTFKSKEIWLILNKGLTGRGYYSRRVNRTPKFWGLLDDSDHAVTLPVDFDPSSCHVIKIPADLKSTSVFEFSNKDCAAGAYTLCQITLPANFDNQITKRDSYRAEFDSAKSTLDGLTSSLQSLPKSSSCSGPTTSEVSSLLSPPPRQLKQLLGKNKLLQLLSKLPKYKLNLEQLKNLQPLLQYSSLSTDGSVVCLCSKAGITTPNPLETTVSSSTEVASSTDPIPTLAPVPPPTPVTTLAPVTTPAPITTSAPVTTSAPANSTASASAPVPPPVTTFPSPITTAPPPASYDYDTIQNEGSFTMATQENNPSPPLVNAPIWPTFLNSYSQSLATKLSIWNSRRLSELIDHLSEQSGSGSQGGRLTHDSKGVQNFHFNFKQIPTENSLSPAITGTPTTTKPTMSTTKVTLSSIKPTLSSITSTSATSQSTVTTVGSTTDKTLNDSKVVISEDAKSLIHLIFAILGSSAGVMALVLALVLLIVGYHKNKKSKCYCCCRKSKRKRKQAIRKVQANLHKFDSLPYIDEEVNKNSSSSSSQNEQSFPLLEMNKDQPNVQSEPTEIVEYFPEKSFARNKKSNSKTKKTKKRVTISNEVAVESSGRKTHTRTRSATVSSSSNECITPYR